MSAVAETQVTVGGHKYSITRMSVFDQMTVAADYRDILIGLAMLKKERPKEMKDADYDQAVHFMIASRGSMTPEVRGRAMSLCLGHVTRNSGVGWTGVLAAENTMQFDDIQMPEIVALLYAVFEHHKFLDFFSASPSSSGEQKENGQSSRTAKTG